MIELKKALLKYKFIMFNFTRVLYTFIFAILFIIPLISLAQENVEVSIPSFLEGVDTKEEFDSLTEEQKIEAQNFFNGGPTLPSSSTALDGSVNCFDYYTFGSVQVDLSSTLAGTIPGVPLTFMGTVVNNNPYPVVDGAVYVKIFRKQSDTNLAKQNGNDLVDQFVVKDDITLAPNGTTTLSFSWKVPQTALPGEYEAAFFFNTANRFNLLGLTFTDDVVGNKSPFTIRGKEAGAVIFNKNNVMLNDTLFLFASFPPHFKKKDSVTASVELSNTTSKDQDTVVSFKQYNWDSLKRDNLIKESETLVKLKAGETKPLTFTMDRYTGTVTYLVVEANTNGQKSILDIRFVRDEVLETRLNFPGVMKYPLTAGETNTIFSCTHSTNIPLVPDNTLILTLTDEEGNTIHEYSYQGGITGAMMGLKSDFTPDRTYSTFTLTATLKLAGKEVDKVSLKYNCDDIDPSLCIPTSTTATTTTTNTNKTNILFIITIITLGVLSGGFSIYKLYPSKQTNTTPLAILFLSILIPFFMLIGEVEAKSVTSNVNNLPLLREDWEITNVFTTDTIPLTDTIPWGVKWLRAVEAGASVSVLYQAELVNNDSGLIVTDGSDVPVGTVLRLNRINAQNTDISWNGTGVALDTPYGYWVDNAGPLSKACHVEDQTFTELRTLNGVIAPVTAYTLLNVKPTIERVLSPSANLACSGNLCTVTAPGPVSISMNFPETFGRFYYRYFDHPEHYGGGCRANNVALRYVPWCSMIDWEFCRTYDPHPVPYDVIIPENTITFNLNAVSSGNLVPNAPTITPGSLNNYLSGSPQSFDFSATDDDGDTIRYGIDWDNDGLLDQWLSDTGYVASGVSQTASYATASGSVTIQVLAQDSVGGNSPWTSYTFTISDPVSIPIASLSATGCYIPTGSDNCIGKISSWSITDASDPKVVDITSGNTFTGASGGPELIPLTYGSSHTIVAYDGSTLITGSGNVISAICPASTHYWDGDTCEESPLPPDININLDQKLIRVGNTTNINIEINTSTPATCTFYNALATPQTFYHDPSLGMIQTYGPYTTRPLQSAQIVTLECVSGGVSTFKEARINVVPNMQEI